MFRANILLRQATRASVNAAVRPATFTAAPITNSTSRAFSKITPKLDKLSPEDPKDDDRHDKFTTSSATETGHEGSASRTDDSIRYEHPDDESELPSSKPVQGRGRNLRTLASFSLEDKVGVVTGGARGLGLVMSQAMVVSGADVAIVDMNSESPRIFTTPLAKPLANNHSQRTRVKSRPQRLSRSSSVRTQAQRTSLASPHTTPMSPSQSQLPQPSTRSLPSTVRSTTSSPQPASPRTFQPSTTRTTVCRSFGVSTLTVPGCSLSELRST